MIAPHSRTSPPVQAPEKYDRGLGWRGTLVGLAACLLAVCTSALATRVVPMATPELFRNSAAIFIGEVRNSDPTCPGGKKPCTKVTFSGVEVLAGNLPQGDVTFDLPEGELDDGSFLRIEGAPRFVPGVRYLVFARSGEWYNTPVTNWFHSVFRELRAGPQASAVFFVDHQGRAVRGLDERGFALGEQVASPNDVMASRVAGSATAMRGQMGVAQSSAPPIDANLKRLGRPDVDWKTVAMPKEELVAALRVAAGKYGLAQKGPVRFSPTQPALRRSQAAAAREQAGLGPAAVEPAVVRGREEQRSDASDAPTLREPAAGQRSHPGQDGSR